MFGKLALVILVFGGSAVYLLAARQSRMQVASELAQAQLRINAADERLVELRTRIAERVTPEQVERMAAEIGGLAPMIPGPGGSEQGSQLADNPPDAGRPGSSLPRPTQNRNRIAGVDTPPQ